MTAYFILVIFLSTILALYYVVVIYFDLRKGMAKKGAKVETIGVEGAAPESEEDKGGEYGEGVSEVTDDDDDFTVTPIRTVPVAAAVQTPAVEQGGGSTPDEDSERTQGAATSSEAGETPAQENKERPAAPATPSADSQPPISEPEPFDYYRTEGERTYDDLAAQKAVQSSTATPDTPDVPEAEKADVTNSTGGEENDKSAGTPVQIPVAAAVQAPTASQGGDSTPDEDSERTQETDVSEPQPATNPTIEEDVSDVWTDDIPETPDVMTVDEQLAMYQEKLDVYTPDYGCVLTAEAMIEKLREPDSDIEMEVGV